MLNENVCVPFHPEMKEPIDAHSLDPETLYTFMMAYAGGDLIELCFPKDQENIETPERRRAFFTWFETWCFGPGCKCKCEAVIISSKPPSKLFPGPIISRPRPISTFQRPRPSF